MDSTLTYMCENQELCLQSLNGISDDSNDKKYRIGIKKESKLTKLLQDFQIRT